MAVIDSSVRYGTPNLINLTLKMTYYIDLNKKDGKGVKNFRFRDDIAYRQPLNFLRETSCLVVLTRYYRVVQFLLIPCGL